MHLRPKLLPCLLWMTLPFLEISSLASPVFSRGGQTVCICDRFGNDILLIDSDSNGVLDRIPVAREPMMAAITKDCKFLLVANHLHSGRADVAYVGAVVSVIDLRLREVIKELQLPNGSGSLKEISVSPNGEYAAVTHIVSRFNRTATHVFRGWMNVNALTVITLTNLEIYGTALLDEPDKGAANPWGIAWSSDSSKLVVTHAGTHEVSIIDFPMLLAQLSPSHGSARASPRKQGYSETEEQAQESEYLPFLQDHAAV